MSHPLCSPIPQVDAETVVDTCRTIMADLFVSWSHRASPTLILPLEDIKASGDSDNEGWMAFGDSIAILPRREG